MSAAAWILIAVAGALALLDWWAVAHRPSSLEVVCKPAVMVALIAAALALDPADGAQRSWFVVALALSLAGDVFLLPKPNLFVPGLASFLLAHVAYIAGFAAAGRGDLAMLVVLAPLVAMSFPAGRVVRAVRADHAELLVPVLVYIVAIGSMLVASWWHGDLLGVAGAGAFVVSDSILATERFVSSRPWMPLAVMVTYHLAQGLLVISLVR